MIDSAQTKYVRERNYNRALQLDNDRLHDLLTDKDDEVLELNNKLINLSTELALTNQKLKLRKLN